MPWGSGLKCVSLWAEVADDFLFDACLFKKYLFFFLYIFRGFCVYVPLPPLRGQHTVLCHPRWLPTSGLTEFAVCWGVAGFKPRTTDLQSGALPLSHLSSSIEPPLLLKKYLYTPTVCFSANLYHFLCVLLKAGHAQTTYPSQASRDLSRGALT